MPDPVILQIVAILAAFLASFVGVLAGFGGNLVFIPIVAIWLGMRDAVMLGLLVGMINPFLVILRHHHAIRWRTLAVMLVGSLPAAWVGLLCQGLAPERALALFVAAVALFSGAIALRPAPVTPSVVEDQVRPFWHRALRWLLLPAGGFVQGAVATSGPFFVAWLVGEERDKSRFRSTLCAFWIALNPVIATLALIESATPTLHAKRAVLVLPAAVVGFLVGDRLHSRLDATGFRRLIAVVLLATGLVVLVRQIMLSW